MTTGVTVDFNANLARFTGSVDKAISDLNKFQSNAERTAAGIRNAFGALGVGLSVAGIVAWGKSTIDAADNLNDLSQRLGIGIKDLARWKLAAEQSGTSTEALAKGVKGLSEYILDHGDKLRAAGVTGRDASTALLQLSDIFAFMPDGVEKTALAVQLFGKAGMELVPMLNLGSKGLGEAQEKAKKYAEELEKLAPDADKFNDALRELKLQSEASAMSIMSKLAPGMEGLARWIGDARSGADGLKSALEYIATKTDSDLMRGLAWLAGESGTVRSQGYKGPKTAAGLPASPIEQFDMASADFVAGGGIEEAYKRKAAMKRALALLNKPSAVDSRLQSMLDRGQTNLYAGLDSEEEMRLIAQKRTIDEAKKEFEDLQRMIGKGQENELALYYETAGEETMRLVAQQRELKDALQDQKSIAEDLGMTFASAFEDAVIGGKKFSDVLKGLADDVLRIVMRKTVTEPLARGVTGFLDGLDLKGLFGGGRASGGAVDASKFYVVGENGPELFAPGLSGSIIPNRSSGAGGGVVVNIIEDSSKAGQVQQRQSGSGQNMLDVFVDRIRSAIAGDIASGSGPVPAAIGNTYGLNRAAGGY